MLHLRLKNPVSARLSHHMPFPFLSPDFPLKPCIHKLTERRFQIMSLPQRDGSYVASIVQAPEIVVYEKSRKAAENKAAQKFLDTADPHAYRSHPLAKTKAVTVDMEFDEESGVFVTYVKELHGISTYGTTELAALDATAEMIRGYLASMEGNRKKVPLTAVKLTALKRVLGSRQNVQCAGAKR
jgi:predicted RNase H-like HicB family nuclease